MDRGRSRGEERERRARTVGRRRQLQRGRQGKTEKSPEGQEVISMEGRQLGRYRRTDGIMRVKSKGSC